MSIFLLLFAYIAVICLAAEVLSYTQEARNAANENSQIFKDLEKLGANKKYLRRLLKSQLAKTFVLPTIMGCLLMFLYELLLLWQNDGILTTGEIKSCRIDADSHCLIGLYQFALYKISMKNAAGVLEI